MDKSWIHLSRASDEYINGVNQFLDYAFEKVVIDEQILCPCVKCTNRDWCTREEVFDHLITKGFTKGYTKWVFHGEDETLYKMNTDVSAEMDRGNDDMEGLLNDTFRDVMQGFSNTREEGIREGPNAEAKKFYKLVEEAQQELYPNCKTFSTLSFTIRLYLLKCLHGWSNASFTALLELLKEAIPILKIPESFNKAKKMVKELGLDYKKIDSCPNDCMLYWKKYGERNSCHLCGASRWKLREDVQCDGDEDSTNTHKIPSKVLWHFPLVPRLQRLFMYSKTAKLMRWNEENNSVDGKLRHPRDGQAWKTFNSRHIDFSSEVRNVRLGLASDGFNPFRTMSVAHSTWPVVLLVYNLPSEICMKPEYFILSLLIPGPRSPGNDIDVFLQPLIEELNELWLSGVDTYDASNNQTFKMHAALLWTISDFPGYAMLSGWSTKGKLACPCCNYETCSLYLKHSHKHCYMCHRRWLEKNHKWRHDSKSFDGKKEFRSAPPPLSGNDVLKSLRTFQNVFGKTQKLKRGDNNPWKKRSIFFELPYWEYNISPHNLDVMHIEKNICDSVLGTLLDIPGKTKDHAKARLDLRDLGIREKLHPIEFNDRKQTVLPKACFSMTEAEKTLFCTVLKNVKLPDGNASNISRCVQLTDKKISGYKSHDAHFILHYLLQVAVRRTLPKEVIIPLVRLGAFYRNLCSKVLHSDDLDWLQAEIVEILCLLERTFPPSFFDIMVHLSIHLVNEVKMGGPVQFRWMYPIERYLCKLKSYVHNRSRPEGSIAEGYLAEECLTFCSRYLSDDVKTKLNRAPRNFEKVTVDGEVPSLFPNVGYPLGGKKGMKGKTTSLDHATWAQAHRYVLFNCDEVQDYIREHEEFINNRSKRKRWAKAQSHSQDFIQWFEDRVTNENVPEKIKILSQGPNFVARRYKGYIINGFRFHTRERDARCKTQNSGVTLTAETSSFASSRDQNPVVGNVRYYGSIHEIIELDYYGQFKTVLFKCEWFQAEEDIYGLMRVNLKKSCYSDDPFVLAFQVHQCFYVEDPIDKEWHYAIKVTSRDVIDFREDESSNTHDCDRIEPTYVMNHAFDDNIEWSREGVPGTTVDIPLHEFTGVLNHGNIEEDNSENDNTDWDFMD